MSMARGMYFSFDLSITAPTSNNRLVISKNGYPNPSKAITQYLVGEQNGAT